MADRAFVFAVLDTAEVILDELWRSGATTRSADFAGAREALRRLEEQLEAVERERAVATSWAAELAGEKRAAEELVHEFVAAADRFGDLHPELNQVLRKAKTSIPARRVVRTSSEERESMLREENRRLREQLEVLREIADALLRRGGFDPFLPLADIRAIIGEVEEPYTTRAGEVAWLAKIAALAAASSPASESDA